MTTRSSTNRPRVRQRAKGPIDPRLGARLRELRIALGMTQRELAGRDFTKAFISLIETGRTRVSLRAAEVLAARLGTTASELMSASGTSPETELLLLRAEQHLAGGHAQEAVQFAELAVTQAGSAALRARGLRVRGRALVEAGRARDGLRSLEDAAKGFESIGNREMAVRLLYDRGVAYAHLNEPGAALTLGLQCEAEMRVGGLIDRTLELQVRSLLAAIFMRSGDVESADSQARIALELSSDVVDHDALGTLYSTLALARQKQHDLDAALGYARKSLAVYEDLGRQQAVGQMWLNLAMIHLEKKELAKAEDAIVRGERIATASKIVALQARLVYARAELAAARRKPADADQLAAQAAAHAGASAVTRGRSLLLRARLAADRRAPLRTVRTLLDEAVEALAQEPARVRAEAHGVYSELLAARGEFKDAYVQARQTLELMRPRLT